MGVGRLNVTLSVFYWASVRVRVRIEGDGEEKAPPGPMGKALFISLVGLMYPAPWKPSGIWLVSKQDCKKRRQQKKCTLPPLKVTIGIKVRISLWWRFVVSVR